MKTADLHLHTSASDGAFSPAELLSAARDAGLAAVAITDHDTVDSVEAAMGMAPSFGLEVIPGIELSVDHNGAELHILGYGIDFRDRRLLRKLEFLRRVRRDRTRVMLDRLAGLGLDLPRDLISAVPGRAVGRLHIARALMEAGHTSSIQEAFSKYIGSSGPAYAPKSKLTPLESIDLIDSLGGVSVLAHPSDVADEDTIADLAAAGLGGLEVYYPSHRRAQVKRLLELARRHRLLVTGGSDCHGLNKDRVYIGAVKMPYRLVEELKSRFRPPEAKSTRR